jgi:hypothetical protein
MNEGSVEDRRVPWEQLVSLADRVEADGGFITVNYNIKIGDETLTLLDSLRLREILMDRMREREQDRSEDYAVARKQGYRAAVHEMRQALGQLA